MIDLQFKIFKYNKRVIIQENEKEAMSLNLMTVFWIQSKLEQNFNTIIAKFVGFGLFVFIKQSKPGIRFFQQSSSGQDLKQAINVLGNETNGVRSLKNN